MTHKDAILEAFRKNNGVLTLGYVLQYPWGYKFASRCADLRKEGFAITCEPKPKPSDNVYRLIEVEESGQMRMNLTQNWQDA